MGGRCGGADDGELESLTRYADAVGLMFQVVDDLLDVTSDAATLGQGNAERRGGGEADVPGPARG